MTVIVTSTTSFITTQHYDVVSITYANGIYTINDGIAHEYDSDEFKIVII